MNQQCKQHRDVIWISHRGLNRGVPENTEAAFRAAVDQGFSVLETDLRLTSDRHIVLSHDADLRRVAGEKLEVAKTSRADLGKVSLPGNARVCFLDQFIQAFPGCGWTFDIKPEQGMETIQVLLEWVRKRQFKDWFTAQARFLLWDPDHEALLRQELPNAQYYARSPECWRAGLSCLVGVPGFGGISPTKVYSLPPRALGQDLYNPMMIRRFHSRGARVLAYLPKNREEIESALQAGVDEVLLDYEIPEAFRQEVATSLPTEVR